MRAFTLPAIKHAIGLEPSDHRVGKVIAVERATSTCIARRNWITVVIRIGLPESVPLHARQRRSARKPLEPTYARAQRCRIGIREVWAIIARRHDLDGIHREAIGHERPAVELGVRAFAGGYRVAIGANNESRFALTLYNGATWGAGGILLASILFFSVLQSRPVLHEVLIAVFLTVTTPVTLMLLGRAALYRDRSENAADVPPPIRADGEIRSGDTI